MTKPYSVWSVGYFSLLICLGISIALVLYYLYIIKPFVTFPADILIWAESNFVGSIIKLRAGLPIYSPAEDGNSSIYTPGAPIVTYVFSWLIGKPTSIVVWRTIQLAFAICAAGVATACCRRLYRLAYPEHRLPFPKTWFVFVFFVMVLAVTTPRANSLIHNLHADSLALLISLISFWTMLRYLESPSRGRIFLMAVCPALGYLIKQTLLGWAAVMFVFLLLQQPRDIRYPALFLAIASAFVAMAVGLCYALWGHSFMFWTFEILGARKSLSLTGTNNIALARIIDNMLRTWFEMTVGIVGGWLILRGQNIRRLAPLFVAWIVLIVIEAYSSGGGWGTSYHLGPGVVIGCVWLFAALPPFWPWSPVTTDMGFIQPAYWVRSLVAVAGVLTVFVAFHVVPTGEAKEQRSWHESYSWPDVYQYIAEIEHEFEGLPADQVLLDVGNWIYLPQSIVMKDRAIPLSDQPPSNIYESFDGFLYRIRHKTYAKILVRDFHSENFIYDRQSSRGYSWPRSSGVREALLKYYREDHVIAAPTVNERDPFMIRHLQPVSVLVPR
jgi:hypothetical protein